MYSAISANRSKSALLIVVFMALVLAVGYVYGWYSGMGWTAVIIAAIVAGVSGFFGYWSSAQVALSVSKARPVSKQEAPDLHNLVENLCIATGLPMPKVYIINDESLNAFATGRNPENSAIAVTTGLLNKLERNELEGVLAHELSHIKNYDILVMTLAVVFAGTISMLGNLFFRWGGITNRGRSSNSRGSGGGLFLIIGLALLILAPLAAMLIRLAVSRQREYLADASGAMMTRYPEGLAKALKRIDADPVIETATSATAHMYIASPLKKGFVARLFSTHPPIKDRIAKLEKMAREA